MAQLMFPDIAGNAQRQFQQGQQTRANRLVGLAMQNPDDAQGYLAQAGAINPQLAMGVQGAMQRQQAQQQAAQQAQQQLLAKQVGGMARYFKAVPDNQKQAVYSSVVLPRLTQMAAAMGKPPPPAQYDPQSEAAIDSVIAQTAYLFPDEMKQQNPISVGPDQTLIDPRTHQVVYQGQGDAGSMVTGMTFNGMPVFRDKMGNLKDVRGNPIPQDGQQATSPVAGGVSGALPAETQAYVPKVQAALGGEPAFDASGQPTAALLDAVQQVESGGNPQAVSPAGAQGPYQFMPATAASVGVQDPFDPTQARQGASKYLAQLYQQFGGDANKAIAAYNAGPGRVQQAQGGTQTAAGLQYTPTGKNADVVAQRARQIQELKARGVTLTDDQRQAYLANGRLPSGSDAILAASMDTPLTPIALDESAVDFILKGPRGLPAYAYRDPVTAKQIQNHAGEMLQQAGLSPNMLPAIRGSAKARESALVKMQAQGSMLARNIQSLDANVQLMLDAAKKVGNTNFKSWNSLVLAAKGQVSDPAVAAYAQSVMNVLDDYGKVMSMSTTNQGVTDGQLRLAQTRISQAEGLPALQATADMIEAGGKNIRDKTDDSIASLTNALKFGNLAEPTSVTTGAGAQQQPQAAPSGIDALLSKYGVQ